MNENNEDQCSKIPDMLKECNYLKSNDKNKCIQNIRNIIKICSDKENYRKKLIASVLSVT